MSIVDSYGRSLHPDSNIFFKYHKQAKRIILKNMIEYFNMYGTLDDYVELLLLRVSRLYS
jgi:hypothetical protein